MPAQRSRKVLLAVSGMSPQIITETLYSLIQEQRWVPDEVRLITTEQGRLNAVQHLLEGEKHFQRLLNDYQISHPIAFTKQHITVIQAPGTPPLSDLRTPEDNEVAADVIASSIRDLTNDEGTELHVSLAGGRKTMGFYAGYALSLFGRPQDRLSHVLVSEHYESNQNFFYPTPYTNHIHTRDGRTLDTREAKVWLAQIPFVRLRNRLPSSLLQGTHSFSETVRLAREATEKVHLILYPGSGSYRVNDRTGKLSPGQMGLLLWAAIRKQRHQPPIEPVVEGEKRSPDELLSISEDHWLSLSTKTENKLKAEGITQQWLEQTVSRLNGTLINSLGPELAERCKLANCTVHGHKGYALPEDLDVRIESISNRNIQDKQ
ncbi:CRISPR-associated ring nuclease Csm6 [Marinimicrobium sp. ARAG 43.8]|uniref:CRISPR-associated ring nuclease Csm6 n=1 Tax=Marinimicrobium sp. ARAG 43.8 TaxID=3418719 RepID=UPI003CEC68C3